ncbi:MAG: TonB-dependent receptor [Acidobacteriaceae bacterium]|nr:TonB-dependent receptor [Acidobacteriaceae bacterium]
MGLWLGALLLPLTTAVCAAATTATVSGVVRDTQGVAQMGALVEVLSVGSQCVGTAFTDLYGQYRIANLRPGKYQVRASAALFVPSLRNNLRLSTGMRATVNLTMGMLSDPTTWLPVERRRPDEPGDDWTWTLRSAANRPILRVLGDVVLLSSNAQEGSRTSSLQARGSVSDGGGFGEGGVGSVVALDRAASDGSIAMLRAEVAGGDTGLGAGPATEISAGFERRTGLAGESRVVVSYASHPEMVSADSGGEVAGLQVLRMASAERIPLGDAVEMEAGGTIYAIHTTGTALTGQPFLRVTVRPGEVWAVRYRLATARDLQGFDGLDSIAAKLPVAAISGGVLRTERGKHQEIALSRKVRGGLIEAAVYHDSISNSTISGGGATGAEELAADSSAGSVVVDTTTGSFRFLSAGYTANGLSLRLSEPLTASLWAELEYQSGAAMTSRSTGTGLSELTSGMHSEPSQAATIALQGRDERTGTMLRASYRWQPQQMMTAVAPYEALSDQGYLCIYLRQAVRWGDRLPPGIEATVDVTNLLAEGYRPFLSADGRTLFLAESPRTIQAGLSFKF